MQYPHDSKESSKSGWREPYFWLVVGGPLIVVVAGITTFFIAAKAPDPVLTRTETLRVGGGDAESKAITKDDLVKTQPAQLARNHAASPHVPASDGKKP